MNDALTAGNYTRPMKIGIEDMTEEKTHLYTDDTATLQISYKEYVELVEKAKEGRRCVEIKKQVLADLTGLFGESLPVRSKASPSPEPELEVEPIAPPASKKVSVEYPAAKPEPKVEKEEKPQPVIAEQTKTKSSKGAVPPIKKDIAEHFNKVDASGRMFNIFKQYYICMNDSCDGPVRVTIKDGICSIWNYDEWAEFAFVDVFDGRIRIGIDSCYTAKLESLDLCEIPRLLASRHNLVCVQVDDLSQIVLDTLVTAFQEVGAVA